jgi:hypothetical protein
MILRNPTENDVSAQILGTAYTIPAGGELSIDSTAGRMWVREIHQFLEVVEDSAPAAPAVVEEEIAEEEEAPAEEESEEEAVEESEETEEVTEEEVEEAV